MGRELTSFQFAGSYSYSGFRSCFAINPWDARGTSEAIYSALTMSADESKSRWTVRIDYVRAFKGCTERAAGTS
jgi:trehalose-6-phosphate synthase